MHILKPSYRIVVYFLSFVVSFSLSGCKTNGSSEETKSGSQEGFIEFETKAVDDKHPLAGLAPSSVILKYKKDKFALEMSTMGIFNTSIIGNLQTKKLVQTIKFMEIKQACIEDENDIKAENDLYKLNIVETPETKTIAGYKCYKLNVNRVDSPEIKFDAYYTKDIKLPENSNALTPYASVKGVLMDYRLKKMGLEMHFVAKKVKFQEIPDNTFEIPAYMKIVSKEEMQAFFANL